MDPASDRLVSAQAAGHSVHLDFGDTQTEYGIPFSIVPADQPRLPILFGTDGADYSDESDRGPFPIPLPRARRAYQPPAGHCGPHDDARYPPYGSRWRLKASFDESAYRTNPPALAIVRALKRYGLMYADQGSAMFITGVSDPRWTSTLETINQRHPISGDAFEVVEGVAITSC